MKLSLKTVAYHALMLLGDVLLFGGKIVNLAARGLFKISRALYDAAIWTWR